MSPDTTLTKFDDTALQGRTLGGAGGGGLDTPNIFRVGPKLDEKSVHDKARIV